MFSFINYQYNIYISISFNVINNYLIINRIAQNKTNALLKKITNLAICNYK